MYADRVVCCDACGDVSSLVSFITWDELGSVSPALTHAPAKCEDDISKGPQSRHPLNRPIRWIRR